MAALFGSPPPGVKCVLLAAEVPLPCRSIYLHRRIGAVPGLVIYFNTLRRNVALDENVGAAGLRAASTSRCLSGRLMLH